MTSLAFLLAAELRERREALEQASQAIRRYQTAVAALAELPEAAEAREWASVMVGRLEAAWHALDFAKWSACPWPGTRPT